MKKHRMTALILSMLLLACPALASCKGDDVPDNSTSQAESGTTSGGGEAENKYVDADGNYTLDGMNMPEFKFSETEFRVCVYDNSVQTTYFSEEIGYDLYTTTDTALNEAVRERNNLVQEKYGVTVVACPVADVNQVVRQESMSPTGAYDAAMPFMAACATMAQEGMLYDLKDYSQFIHLEAPWWDQSANSSLSIANKVYFTTGDISIMQKIVSSAILFNRTMYQENLEATYGSLYDLVREHKWTLDTMYAMGKVVTAETDGQAGMTLNDTWGITGADGIAGGFYTASGYSYISKDHNDLPVLQFGNSESGIAYAQKVLQIFQTGDEWFLNTSRLQGQVDNIYETALAVFGEGRALFYNSAFSAVKKMRNYPLSKDFGIVPRPLASEGQDIYYNATSAGMAYGICIPKSVPNPEFSAYMIEALCCYAKNTITPAYYDVILKVRGAQDDDSEEMLDKYVFSHVVYDLANLFAFGGVGNMMTTLMSQNSTSIISELDSKRDMIVAAIEECIEAYELND